MDANEDRLKKIKEALKQKTEDLEKTVAELDKMKKMVKEQQLAQVAEERLKVLLQMAGATAHELNQPLTALLGNIQLLRMKGNVTEIQSKYLSKIELSGERIAEIVRKINDIRHSDTKVYAGNTSIINLDQNGPIR